MEYEIYTGLKKGKGRTFEILCREHLKRSWFLCYQLTRDVCTAAPLLLSAWGEAVDQVRGAQSPPSSGFKEILSAEILTLFLDGMEQDSDYSTLPPPEVAPKYRPFVEGLQSVSEEYRPVYLMNLYGGLSKKRIAGVIGSSPEQVSEMLNKAEKEVSDHAAAFPYREQWALHVQSSAEFRNSTGSGFQEIQIPDFLQTSLEHRIGITLKKPGFQHRKEAESMAGSIVPANGGAKAAVRKKRKLVKTIALSVAVCVVVVLAAVLLPRLFGGNAAGASSVTTYHVEAVSYGDVNTTISGSGTLSPVSRDTLTNTAPATVSAVNYTAGDTVEAGAAIATVVDSEGNSSNITAPYDCVLLELPVTVGSELDANSEIAMVMGLDGFTMGIAVDELDISTVQVGQEVTFTIDAADGEYTGEVTAVSYNGSTNGNTTAFQITASVDYVEGVYPGMSASAEIVIESSGEGLLVPVEAVQTSGDDNYVYLAPDGAAEGAEYEESELDPSSLTQVIVETGMSDGSYILVESDELAEGGLIVIPRLTSTQTGSGSGDEGGIGGFGGGPGGGMNFGDFENFDPSNMPQGGGFPGGN